MTWSRFAIIGQRPRCCRMRVVATRAGPATALSVIACSAMIPVASAYFNPVRDGQVTPGYVLAACSGQSLHLGLRSFDNAATPPLRDAR